MEALGSLVSMLRQLLRRDHGTHSSFIENSKFSIFCMFCMANVSNLPFKKNSPAASVKTKIARPPPQRIWISSADPEPRNLHLTSISGDSSIGGPWPVKPNLPRTVLVYTCCHGLYSMVSKRAFSQSKVSWLVKESLGLEKKTMVSNALLLNHLTSGKTKVPP